MTEQELNDILDKHRLWLGREKGGVYANLAGADLRDADLRYANLRYANLWDADLRDANLRDADLRDANLRNANLRNADLRYANLVRANLVRANLADADLGNADLGNADLRNADLRDADLRVATLLCAGNLNEIRTMQNDTWAIGYTADTLQIGCQRHPIDKWRKWDTPAGRKWIDGMDHKALEWADRNLALVLAMIDANPATPTGHELEKDD